jgi:hypothetical protein
MAPVLKTDEGKPSVSSNLTAPAKFINSSMAEQRPNKMETQVRFLH